MIYASLTTRYMWANTFDHTIIAIDKNTADGQTARALETHNVPSSLRKIYGIATFAG